MEKFAGACLWLVLAGFVCQPASAASTITHLKGDKDGFNLGVVAGSEFDIDLVNFTGDGDGTDAYLTGSYSWTHIYNLSDLSGPITAATLEIFHGGDGFYGPSEVFLNGTSIGFLTDSDGWDDDTPPYSTYPSLANVDVFDLMPYAHLLTGNDTILVQTWEMYDGWVLDYSALTLSAPSSVPAPAAILLGGLGASLVGLLRRRRVV